MDPHFMSICTKFTSVAACEYLVTMNFLDLMSILVFLGLVAFVTWVLCCRSSQNRNSEVLYGAEDALRSFNNWNKTLESRLNYLQTVLSIGRQSMSKRDFQSAITMFDLGIEFANQQNMNQTQISRDVWAKLLWMKSVCCWHLGDFIQSMKELDSALRASRYPSVELQLCAHQVFQLFCRWSLEDVKHRPKNVVICNYLRQKVDHLKEANAKGRVYPYLLLEATHCLLLTDSLTSRNVPAARNLATVEEIISLCLRFESLLSVANSERSTSQTSGVKKSSSSGSQQLNNGTTGNVAGKVIPVASKSVSGKGRTLVDPRKPKPEVDKDKNSDTVKPDKSRNDSIASGSTRGVKQNLKSAGNCKNQNKDSAVGRSADPEPKSASVTAGSGRKASKKASRRRTQSRKSSEASVDEAKRTFSRSCSASTTGTIETENSGVTKGSVDNQILSEFKVDSIESAFQSEADNFRVLRPGAVDILGERARSKTGDPRPASLKLFAELFARYGMDSVCLACDICLNIGSDDTNRVKINPAKHNCARNRLVIVEKSPTNEFGMLVRLRPWAYNPYETRGLCESVVTRKTCIEKQRCKLPHSDLERSLWQRDFAKEISIPNFIQDFSSVRFEHLVSYLMKKFSGSFELLCKKCFAESGREETKSPHWPHCRQGHLWDGNERLVFQLTDSRQRIHFDAVETDIDPELRELFDFGKILASGIKPKAIAEKSRQLRQQIVAGKNVDPPENNIDLEIDADSNADPNSLDIKPMHLERDEDVFDQDLDGVLDPCAFDEDSGDQFETTESKRSVARPSFDPYYLLLEDNNDVANNRFKRGVIHLIGPSNAVCRLSEDGRDLKLSGRMNCGPAFDGDEVLVEMKEYRISRGGLEDPDDEPVVDVRGTVVRVEKRRTHRSARTFVCTVDKYRSNLMRPLCGTVPKFHVVDSELERKYGKEKKLDYVAVYHMEERGLILKKTIQLNPKSREEMLFVVKYLKWDPKHMYPLGYVCRITQTGNDFAKSINVLNLVYEISPAEPRNCEESVRKYENFIESDGFYRLDPSDRIDLRELFTVSIDPTGCKDVDDALSIIRLSDDAFTVSVHIADVGHFVRKGDAVNDAAMKRAMSFYPEGNSRSIHMLHSKMATNLFSLLESKDRYAITIVFKLDRDGKLRETPKIVRSLIRNNKQISYEDAQEIIDDNRSADPTEDANGIDSCIVHLHKLAVRLRSERMKNSQFYYDYEIKSFLRKEGIQDPFEIDQCHDAHRLVEEFMILANRTVAEHLLNTFPCEAVPIRQQDEPNCARVQEWYERHESIVSHSFFFDCFRDYFRAQNVQNVEEEDDGGTVNSPENLSMLKCSWKSLCRAVERGDIRKVRTILGSEKLHPVHSLTLNDWFAIQESAKFSPAGCNSRHFGLQTTYYVQFTSPMRRFMDIVVHQMVNASLDGLDSPYTESEIQMLCEKMNHRMSLSKSYYKSCAALKMADLLSKPFYMPCLVGKFDAFGIQIKVPFFEHTTQKQQEIKYSALNVNGVPRVEEARKVRLSWEKRFYDTMAGGTPNARDKTTVDERITLSSELHGVTLSADVWKLLQDTVVNTPTDATFLRTLKRLIQSVQSDRLAFNEDDDLEPGQRLVTDITSEMKPGVSLVKHHVSFSTDLRNGSVLAAQFGRAVIDGFMQPRIHLINLSEGKDICIEHRTEPVKCFAALASHKTRMHYTDITEYQQIWIPILHMESATNAAASDDPIVCNHVPIRLEKQNDMWLGELTLKAKFCLDRHIKLFMMKEEENETHDYLCIRYHLDAKYPKSLIRNVWTCHAVAVRNVTPEDKPESKTKAGDVVLRFRVCSNASDPPIQLLDRNQECTVEFLYRTLPDKRMAKAVESLMLPKSSELCRKISLGVDTSTIIEPTLTPFKADSFHINDIVVKGERKILRNNEKQEEAIRTSLSERFTLVQGPPGTGKTLTGVKIAYWFVQMNLQSDDCLEDAETDSEDEFKGDFPVLFENSTPVRKQVLFCGPSNSSVDVAAKQLISRLGDKCPRIVRVYSEMRETADFPIPRDLLITKSTEKKHSRNHNLQDDPEIQNISLHRIIRREGKRFSGKILEFDRRFARNMKTPDRVSEEEVSAYHRLITKACTYELKFYDIILCTCTASPSARLLRGAHIEQIIVDECGMCMEPESLIPMVNFPTAKQIVLIGDHMQLQPIIKNSEAKKLGLNVSLFQRYAEEVQRAKDFGAKRSVAFVMLDTQYRMNEKICEFPSNYFYNGELKTAKNSLYFRREDHFLTIWPNTSFPMVFCHVEGVERSQAVTTVEGNEESKSNAEECYHVLRYARELINTLQSLHKYKARPDKHIAILSQYKAQCSMIKDELVKTGSQCDVSTVVASQGGEWDYVILSTVRSLPEYEIDRYPSDGWCMKNLGFICDLHQINVALTRARMGLIIIGNKNLLRCDKMWRELLMWYEEHGCVLNAEDFLKTALIRGYAEDQIPRLSRRPRTAFDFPHPR